MIKNDTNCRVVTSLRLIYEEDTKRFEKIIPSKSVAPIESYRDDLLEFITDFMRIKDDNYIIFDKTKGENQVNESIDFLLENYPDRTYFIIGEKLRQVVKD